MTTKEPLNAMTKKEPRITVISTCSFRSLMHQEYALCLSYSGVGAGDVAASRRKNFGGKIDQI